MKLNTISEAIRKFFATCGDLIDGAFLGALMIAGVLAIALVFTAVFPVREAQKASTPVVYDAAQASSGNAGFQTCAPNCAPERSAGPTEPTSSVCCRQNVDTVPPSALAQKASTFNVYDQTQTSGNQGLQTLAQKASDAFTYDQTCSPHCPDGVAGSLDLVGHHWWQIYPAGSMTLQFSGPDGMTMAINADTGQVMFGEGVTPDEATKLFIKAMHDQWPEFCPSYAAESKEEK